MELISLLLCVFVYISWIPTLDVLVVGDFLSAGIGLIWTLGSSSLVSSFSSFGSSMSADSDFFGTKRFLKIETNRLEVKKRKSYHYMVGFELPTSFFPAVPDEFLGDPPPARLRAQQLQFGNYRQVVAYCWTQLIEQESQTLDDRGTDFLVRAALFLMGLK